MHENTTVIRCSTKLRNEEFLNFTIHHSCIQIKEDGIGGTYIRLGIVEKCIEKISPKIQDDDKG
jgi:hypothetical protein